MKPNHSIIDSCFLYSMEKFPDGSQNFKVHGLGKCSRICPSFRLCSEKSLVSFLEIVVYPIERGKLDN